MSESLPAAGAAVAERLAAAALAARPDAAMRAAAQRLLLDITGLCVAARATEYVAPALAAAEPGSATAIGHAQKMSAADAALVNGTAAHGEDFDDTFEGGPIHAGAVMVPAVLAAAEKFGLSGGAVLQGIAVGAEAACRLSTVIPKAVHKAGFHPTSVFGTPAAALAVGTAMGLPAEKLAGAVGIAGSMASGIIEYLAEGAWTKRMHPGWAAQGGLRAAVLAQHGFFGPRTVMEGTHGLFFGFTRGIPGGWDALLEGFGSRWVASSIAFKPYASGTMTQPYIDCARRLRAAGVSADQVVAIECETAEGILHRLWQPLAAKQAPPNGYAAKFSVPYCVAAGLVLDDGGIGAFADDVVARADLQALCRKVTYVVDPKNPYPNAFTGHVRTRLSDGRVVEERQANLRGGANDPLSQVELEEKFRRNCAHGGWDAARIEATLGWVKNAFDAKRVDVAALGR
jgi:2-methylcitrate dehydratase PrpD